MTIEKYYSHSTDIEIGNRLAKHGKYHLKKEEEVEFKGAITYSLQKLFIFIIHSSFQS